jgi:alpha-tubulin suppressor-like RCC1 family protein
LVGALVLSLAGLAHASADPGIQAGDGHTCVLFGGSAMWCWGRNDVGQLGDGTTTDRRRPLPLGSGVRRMAVGDRNVCRLLIDGFVVNCTGANQFGQIGDGTTDERHGFTPVAATGLWTFTAGDTPCGSDQLGTNSYCWGSNQNGSVGDGTTTDRASPVFTIAGAWKVVTSGAGGHACAIVGQNPPYAVWCWGNNVDDALGLGSGAGPMAATPVQITLPNGGFSGSQLDLSVGVHHSCALVSDGTLWCWGANDHGQLGNGTTQASASPVQVTGLSGLWRVHVSPTGAFTCAMADAGVYCWGRNDRGQLGDGTTTERHAPVLVAGSDGFAAILRDVAVGTNHACAYTGLSPQTEGASCWGANDRGQVGDGTTTDRLTPVALAFSGTGVPALGARALAGLAGALLVAGALAVRAGLRRAVGTRATWSRRT